jgi:ketosteroid isomerase-like protein
MSADESAVREATVRFYNAIEAMVSGKGLEPMQEAWHHTDRVTTGHPRGDWARGWDEVLATWKVFAGFGREGRGGSRIRDLQVNVYGDFAYTTCIFVASPAFGGDSLACTNILHRMDGVWKIIHHHVDKSPAMGAALEKIAREE